MRILIAEDDLTSRLMLQAVLGKFGYDVSIAKDGEEAMSFGRLEICSML